MSRKNCKNKSLVAQTILLVKTDQNCTFTAKTKQLNKTRQKKTKAHLLTLSSIGAFK